MFNWVHHICHLGTPHFLIWDVDFFKKSTSQTKEELDAGITDYQNRVFGSDEEIIY